MKRVGRLFFLLATVLSELRGSISVVQNSDTPGIQIEAGRSAEGSPASFEKMLSPDFELRSQISLGQGKNIYIVGCLITRTTTATRLFLAKTAPPWQRTSTSVRNVSSWRQIKVWWNLAPSASTLWQTQPQTEQSTVCLTPICRNTWRAIRRSLVSKCARVPSTIPFPTYPSVSCAVKDMHSGSGNSTALLPRRASKQELLGALYLKPSVEKKNASYAKEGTRMGIWVLA